MKKFKEKLIRIRKEDCKKLELYKVHPSQPMWEVIKNLIEEKEKWKLKKK